VNLALVQQQRISVPEDSLLGHISMAGFGIVLLIISVWCINGTKKKKVPMGPWGPMFGILMDKAVTQPTKRMADKWSGGTSEGFDWRSLMTFLIGMLSVTAILSSTGGFVLSLADFVQGLVLKMSGWPVVTDIGAGGICLLLGFMAMRNRGDDKADLGYGAVCGFFFPLGGGVFSQITLQVGHWIPQIMHIH
jgi:hypothetical protein